jgi:hypothetical protein
LDYVRSRKGHDRPFFAEVVKRRLPPLFNRISPVMGTDGQEHNGLVGKIIAKTVLAFGHLAALFADNKYNTKVPVDARAAASGQVQFTGGVRQLLCIVVGVGQYPVDAAFDFVL